MSKKRLIFSERSQSLTIIDAATELPKAAEVLAADINPAVANRFIEFFLKKYNTPKDVRYVRRAFYIWLAQNMNVSYQEFTQLVTTNKL